MCVCARVCVFLLFASFNQPVLFLLLTEVAGSHGSKAVVKL